MDKRRATQILTKSANLYKENLEDNKILFLYGTPSEIKKQLHTPDKMLSNMEHYEAAFHRHNFMHLTGIKIKGNRISSSIHFYEMCLASRLMEEDFECAQDGSTIQKLEVLETMMSLKKKAAMIGNFSDPGPKLYTQKVAGGTYGCIGFIRDKNTSLNVPNTLLKKDIRDITISPTKKIYAILYKNYTEETYSNISKIDKELDIIHCKFHTDIENILNRHSLTYRISS